MARGGIGAELSRLLASSAAGSYDTSEVSHRDVSGIFLCVSSPSVLPKLLLSATLYKPTGPAVLLPEMPAEILAEVADIEQGMSCNELASNVAAGDSTVNTICTVVLPLGYLRLRETDKLQVTLKAKTVLGASDFAFCGWVRSGFQLGESIVQYTIHDADKAITVDDVRALYLARRDISGGATSYTSALNSAKLSALLRVDGVEQSIGGDVAHALTCALGDIAGAPPKQVCCIYREPDSSQTVESASVTISGTDSAYWSILVAAYYQDPQRASRKGEEAMAELANRLTALEARNPLAALQARRQGRSPNLRDVRAVLGQRRANNLRRFGK